MFLALSETISFGQLLADNMIACIGHYFFVFVSMEEGVSCYENTDQFFSLSFSLNSNFSSSFSTLLLSLLFFFNSFLLEIQIIKRVSELQRSS